MRLLNRPLKVFINYRQADNRDFVLLLYAHLTQRYGKDNVFMDFTAANFVDITAFFAQKVREHDVVLCVIGPHWLDLLRAKAKDGDDDLVLAELRAAMAEGIVIAPVLIKGAQMPALDDVPEDLHPIFRTLAPSIDSQDKYFEQTIQSVLQDMENVVRGPMDVTNATSSEGAAPVTGAETVYVPPTMADVVADAPLMSQQKILRSYYEAVNEEDYELALVWLERLRNVPGALPARFEIDTRQAELQAKLADAALMRQRKTMAEQLYEQLLIMAEYGEDICDGVREVFELDPDFEDYQYLSANCGEEPELNIDDLSYRVRQVISAPFEWAVIPAGQVVGDSGKRVRIEPFLLAKYCISNAQFNWLVHAGGYDNPAYWRLHHPPQQPPRGNFYKHPTDPRTHVNWYETVAFCAWLSEETGLQISLPGLAEWQWAAQGPLNNPYAWGRVAPTKRLANWNSNEDGPSSVDSYFEQARLSLFGLYNMSGNVWEWTNHDMYISRANKTKMLQQGKAFVCGGAWDSKPSDLRLTSILKVDQVEQSNAIGFRIACRLPS